MADIHLVTGGTGFLGTGIILELLQQTSAEIVCIVRPGAEAIDTRLHKAVIKAGELYGYDSALLATVQERCRVVPGDVTSELCGIKPQMLSRITQFWHCAASLRYEDRYEAEIFQTNTEGTRHAIELARCIGIDSAFNYISTAYVAGKQTGIIREELSEMHFANNHYERSKIQAEHIVAHVTDFRTRIFRPSIVIGHSTTYAVASGFSGLYGFLRKLLQFKSAMSRVRKGFLAEEAIQMHIQPDTRSNLMPIDFAARQAVCISASSSPASIFHLTNAISSTCAEVIPLMHQILELKAPVFTATKEEFSWIDRKFDESITFYQSYLVNSKQFDRSHSDAALGDKDTGAYSLNTERLRLFCQWYLDLLVSQRPRLVVTK